MTCGRGPVSFGVNSTVNKISYQLHFRAKNDMEKMGEKWNTDFHIQLPY